MGEMRRRNKYSESPSPRREPSRSRSPVPKEEPPREEVRREEGRRDDVEPNNPGNNLYITGLSTRVTEKELTEHLNREGKVLECRLVVDPRTRESRGFGFVTMASTEDAERCMKYLNRSTLEGRIITIEKAKRNRARTPTPGEYLGIRAPPRSRAPVYSSSSSRYRERGGGGGGGGGGDRRDRDDYYRRSPRYSPYRGGSRDRSPPYSPYRSSDRSYRRDRSPGGGGGGGGGGGAPPPYSSSSLHRSERERERERERAYRRDRSRSPILSPYHRK